MEDLIHASIPHPNGRLIEIHYLTFGRARINIGPVGSMVYDDAW